MREAYTVKIFMIDGDPNGVRTIENDEWKGKALIFPRDAYEEATQERSEFKGQGIYILQGYEEDEAGQEIPVIYIGKTTDKFTSRLNQHSKNRLEWEEGILLSAPPEILHQGKVSWLEHKFIELAREIKRSRVENTVIPSLPQLSESDENEVQRFFNQALKVLPLGGFNVFNKEEKIKPQSSNKKNKTMRDTIIVPASMNREETFNKALFEEKAWWAIRISKEKMPHITHIAFYQTRPISAIQYIAEIDSFELYGDDGKYKVIFKDRPEKLPHIIEIGDQPHLAPQAPQYVSFDKLKTAKNLKELFK